MSGYVNKAIVVGNMGKDPEVRTTQDGKKIATLSVATSESWSDRSSGERKERTEWHRIVIFNERLSDVAERFLRRGMKVYIEGALQTRKWTDQSGQERYSTEIVLQNFRGDLQILSGRAESGSAEEEPDAPRGGQRRPSHQGGQPSRGNDLDDEIPF